MFLALLAHLLAARGFGFWSFVTLTAVVFLIAFGFHEWRRVFHALLALALTGSMALSLVPSPIASPLSPLLVGTFATLLYARAADYRDPHRLMERTFGVATTLFASFVFFSHPALSRGGTFGALVTFLWFAVVMALIARNEARGWDVLRVGEGRLIGAAVGFVAAEFAAFVSLFPLGAARSAVLTALFLLFVREGLAEGYRGGLRRELLFRWIAALFVFGTLIFASTSWSI